MAKRGGFAHYGFAIALMFSWGSDISNGTVGARTTNCGSRRAMLVAERRRRSGTYVYKHMYMCKHLYMCAYLVMHMLIAYVRAHVSNL